MRKEGISNHISSSVRLLVQRTASRRLAKVFKDFKSTQTIFLGRLMYLIQVNVVLFIDSSAIMYFLSSVHWLHPFQIAHDSTTQTALLGITEHLSL